MNNHQLKNVEYLDKIESILKNNIISKLRASIYYRYTGSFQCSINLSIILIKEKNINKKNDLKIKL